MKFIIGLVRKFLCITRQTREILAGFQSSTKSFIQGDGLGNSIAGELSKFTIHIKDTFEISTFENENMLDVVITSIQNHSVLPVIVECFNDSPNKYTITYNATVAGLYGIYISWNSTILAKNYSKLVFPGASL